MPSRTELLRQVREAVDAVEQRTADRAAGLAPSAVATGWPAVDAMLPRGGLRRKVVHEWFGGEAEAPPPLSVLVHLARQGLTAGGGPQEQAGGLVWIGQQVWPYPPSMRAASNGSLLARSLFVDAPHVGERLWAADLTVRSPAVGVVVLDGRGLDMAATRRLQLAAQAGSALVLVARPANERSKLSAAGTRWRVTPMVSPTRRPRWAITLLRCKGEQRGGAGTDANRTWIVEASRAKGLVCIPAGVADSAAAATVAAKRSASNTRSTRQSA